MAENKGLHNENIKLASELIKGGKIDALIESTGKAVSLLKDITINELVKKLSATNKKIITVKKDLDRKTVREIKRKGLRELSYEVKNKRIYPQGTLASHILGFYNPNADTAGGIEYKAKDKQFIFHEEEIKKY